VTPLATLADIRRARSTQPDAIRHTPLIKLARDSAEVGQERLFLKAESLQVTGAYKPRGTFNIMLGLPSAEREKGVVVTSSGNFAQAFAYAGKRLGIPVVVVMLERANPVKIAATRGYGAEVILHGSDPLALQPAVEAIARDRGMTAIDIFEDPRIIPGHGTAGLEILEDLPDVETVLVPVSSGGLVSGIAVALKESKPGVAVWGVQPERADSAFVSLSRGEPTTIDYWDTAADALAAVRPGAYPFQHLQRYVDGIIRVTEDEIATAMATLLFRAKVVAEPAGAVAAAACLSGRVPSDRNTVAVVSGGNVNPARLQEVIGRGIPSP